MSCRTSLVCIALLCLLVLPPSPARAQFAGIGEGAQPGSVSAMGTATVKERPTVLRMIIQLSEKAESLQDALNQLKDRREAALLQLESLGFEKDKIVIDEPTPESPNSPQRRQMEQMMRMMRSQGRSVPKALEQPKLVTITCLVTAERPLEATAHDDILVFANDLADKVTAADLAGTKEAKKLSPEAEELAEEMEGMMSDSSYGEEEVNPGEPRFFYVARLSQESRDKAMAEAFARAKANAERLATAAGVELGGLASLSGSAMHSENQTGDYYGGSSYQMRMMMAAQQMRSDGGDEEGTEAVVQTPGTATFRVMVQANFHLKSNAEPTK